MPRDTPATAYGLLWDPEVANQPFVAEMRNWEGWRQVPVVTIALDTPIYATEQHLSSTPIERVVGGEPFREGYDPYIAIDTQGRYVVIDGHHRAAMHLALGHTHMNCHIAQAHKTGGKKDWSAHDVEWYLPGRKTPVGYSTRATSDMIDMLAEEGLTIRQIRDALLYDDEGQRLLDIYIDKGYGDYTKAQLDAAQSGRTAAYTEQFIARGSLRQATSDAWKDQGFTFDVKMNKGGGSVRVNHPEITGMAAAVLVWTTNAVNRFLPKSQQWDLPDKVGMISTLSVNERFRRMGLATEMLRLAREKAARYGYTIVHEDDPARLSDDGRAWSQVVGKTAALAHEPGMPTKPRGPLYHGSKTELPIGTILHPNPEWGTWGLGYQSQGVVWMTTSKDEAAYWAEGGVQWGDTYSPKKPTEAWVYEVEPIGPCVADEAYGGRRWVAGNARIIGVTPVSEIPTDGQWRVHRKSASLTWKRTPYGYLSSDRSEYEGGSLSEAKAIVEDLLSKRHGALTWPSAHPVVENYLSSLSVTNRPNRPTTVPSSEDLPRWDGYFHGASS